MRNYLADMDAAITAACARGWPPPTAATWLYHRLMAEDPDLLAGWLEARAAVILTDAVRARTQPRQAA